MPNFTDVLNIIFVEHILKLHQWFVNEFFGAQFISNWYLSKYGMPKISVVLVSNLF